VEIKSRDPLPKDSLTKPPLPGVVRPQWVRCGRPACRCARGRQHRPYCYRFWREGGRLRKQYVRPAELLEVRARCEARQRFRRELRDGLQKWRGLRAVVRETESQP
jgi:hypothetical protein